VRDMVAMAEGDVVGRGAEGCMMMVVGRDMEGLEVG
jgi:hypothetical protein